MHALFAVAVQLRLRVRRPAVAEAEDLLRDGEVTTAPVALEAGGS